jgi:ABC-type nitrate/sulfonate/bicarbonate transport system ATPase subunit
MIKINDLTLKYKNSSNILESLNFDINKGEIFAIMGPSGCGKTTLLNYIQGINKDIIKVSGSIDTSEFQKIRTVFQESRLLPWLSVEDNIAFGLASVGIEEKDARELVQKYLKLVGLEKSAKLLPKELSIGMQQRVNFARALVCKPDLLLLDEPFSALDIITKESLQEEFLNVIKKEKITAMFVTHNIDEATKISDKVIVFSSCPAKVDSIINKGERHKVGDGIKIEFDPFGG